MKKQEEPLLSVFDILQNEAMVAMQAPRSSVMSPALSSLVHHNQDCQLLLAGKHLRITDVHYSINPNAMPREEEMSIIWTA
jgi:hypothetical protein